MKYNQHGINNLAMEWDKSFDSSLTTETPKRVKAKLPIPELSDQQHAVEAGGHMQRPKYPTSYAETLAHYLKGNIASGMFAMGDAFKNGGLLLSPVLTIFLGLICVFNQHILVNCANAMRERNKLNYYPGYDDTVELCLESGPSLFRRYAKFGRLAVNIFLTMVQLGFCCVYMVFVTRTMHQILSHFGYSVEFHQTMVITLMVILAFILIRNLKYLAPVSMFATAIMIGGLGLTLYISSTGLPSVTSRTAVASLSQLPLFFGTVVYAYEGISLVLPLQTEMKHPEKFNSPLGVLNVANVIVTVLMILVGFVGYLKYGEQVEGSLTLNLPDGDILSLCVKIAIAVGMLLTYPIMFYVPVALIWPVVDKQWGPFSRPALAEYAMRIGLCLLTFVLAEVIPNLSVFITLVGAVSSTALALVLPPLCDLAIRSPDNDFGMFNWRKHVDYLTLVIAAFGFLTGTYFSLVEIVQSFSS